MSTNIRNKAEQVKAWTDGMSGTITLSDLQAQVLRRWPDLLPEIREQIAQHAFALCIRQCEPF